MTDAQLKDLVDDTILTGGRRTTAANERTLFKQIIDGKQNVADKNAASGYCGLNSDGKVASAQLGVAAPAGSILYDDGSYKRAYYGNAKFNGDGGTVTFNIPHGLGAIPSGFSVNASSADASGAFYITADATNVIVTYVVAPIVGVLNVELRFMIFQ